MSREKDPREWLHYAENDQRAAKALIEAEIYEHCVFHCQQAVEKLLKAIIVKQTGDRPPAFMTCGPCWSGSQFRSFPMMWPN
ncbi:MAG: HEPN domain-containing protein [Anaerolineales bacterium]